ncbi:CXXC-type zinc finger protein 1-like protein [Leptotrombidium deliense]|uniref:CXXC-type zinc finger protein 1 n=1 Tax=Leptotrombidium deliense TaxID=299467 RepID=A0A443SC24_9ACAR|nr:CXXC-type zinc finger protein 1-like protein [Leptotrombidium deliense]
MVDPNRSVHFDHFNKHFANRDAAGIDEDEENETVYCICRTSDTSRFMIGCDKCNEWYHGDCISVTEVYAKTIKKFYCLICREKDSSLEIKYKEKKQPAKKERLEKKTKASIEVYTDDKFPVDPDYEPEVVHNKHYITSEEEEEEDDDEDEDEFVPRKAGNRGGRKPGSKRGRSIKKETTGTKRGKKGHRKSQVRGSTKDGKRKKFDDEKKSYKKEYIEVDEGPKQCYGPGCIKVARKGSKYCSDECGTKLAANRIYEILPHRIRQWQSTPSAADEMCQKALESIRSEQQNAKRILEELDLKQKLLEELISKSLTIPPISEDESNEEGEVETELSIYCVTCGHEVNYRLAMRHMERCFNKYESQTSYGSAFKTKIEGVFCDTFNVHQKTYCKRLKVLCPEHSKDPKIGDDEVCGCPLVNNCFDYTGTFCRELKKKCSKHYGWAKLRRAELDMEKLQQWFKLDELFEKEQKMRFTMANRGGVLALMLHQTIIQE